MDRIIEDFKEKCIEWQKPFDKKEIHFVYNNDLDILELKDIKYILVADNPGNMEAVKGRYLIGPAGMSARVYFDRAMVSDFKKEVLVLNKTPIHTSITNKLKEFKEVSIESQKYMVEMIVSLHTILNVPIIISGYSNGLTKRNGQLRLNSNSLRLFFELFAKAVKEGRINDYYIISHFSRDMFYKSNHISILDYEENPKNLLINQGENNRRLFELGLK